MKSVVIADDHALYRDGLRLMFKKEKQYELVGEAVNGQELVEIFKDKKPDIILTDIKMPVMDGIEATKQILALDDGACIIALSMFEEESFVIDMLESGAKGYLLKDAGKDEILEGLEDVLDGKPCFARTFSPRLLRLLAISSYNPYKGRGITLTDKELEVVECLCQDLKSKEIAERIGVGARTVEWYKQKLMEKMEAKSTVGIVIYAIKHNLVHIV